MTTIAMASVRQADLKAALGAVGVEWNAANHITATVSLSDALEEGSNRVALPIANLLDLIVLPARPQGFNLQIAGFPGQDSMSDDRAEYRKARKEWRAQAGWCQFRLEFLMGNALRSTVRSTAVPLREGAVLLQNRADFLKSITGLSAAGMSPSDFSTQDDLPAAAITLWEAIEDLVPAAATLRETLWIDPRHLAAGASSKGQDSKGQDVAARIRGALDAAFGPVGDGARRTLVHHGFYFYTPPQWQLFQLIGGLQEVDQIFIVHDDGKSPSFKSWRLFFEENDWQMPDISQRPEARNLALPAREYVSALTGQAVDGGALSGQLKVQKYANAAEFARDWSATRRIGKGPTGYQFYGASSKTLARLVRRLDRDQSNGPVDLSELPVGTFLLALHRCVHTSPGVPPRLRLTGARLIDIVASGYLDVVGSGDPGFLAALRRCIGFFDGCDDAGDWVTRGEALHRLVLDEVSLRGVRQTGDTDLERIRRYLGNPLRLLPWADLSVDEARFVSESISAVVSLLHATVALESATFNEHLRTLRDRMERGLRDLPATDAEEIRSKFSSFGDIGDAVVLVDEVIDIVHMVLGRTPAFGTAGDDAKRDNDLVRPLRSLDALGFAPSESPMHLGNLSEASFPTSAPGLGWPFREKDLKDSSRATHEISLGIIRTRSEHAGQGDLYLLHLALDGIPQNAGTDPTSPAALVLSWIGDLDGHLHSASSLVTLVTAIGGVDERVQKYIGGVPIEPWLGPAQQPALRQVQTPSADPSPGDLPAAITRVDGRALAISNACARRLALQWLLGDTPAYRSPHHHLMLYGNVLGAMLRDGESETRSQRIVNDLWRPFTRGQRSSSEANAVIQQSSVTPIEWLLTLESRRGNYRAAYEAAGDQRRGRPTQIPDVDVVVPPGNYFLPPGAEDSETCKPCPVRGNCAAVRRE